MVAGGKRASKVGKASWRALQGAPIQLLKEEECSVIMVESKFKG